MKCAECGNLNSPGAGKCALCHAALPVEASVAAPAREPWPAAAPPPPPTPAPAATEWRCACGRKNAGERSTCLMCGASRPGTAPAKPRPAVDLRELGITADARIASGASRESVEAFLVSHGMPAPDAREIVSRASAVRDRSFRWQGAKDLALGAVILLALWGLLVASGGGRNLVSAVKGLHGNVKMFIVLGVMLAAGPVFVVRGIVRLARGGRFDL